MAVMINAENAILGRIATIAAKKLLAGEKVEIVNAEKALISGSKKFILEKYRVKFERSPKGNPTKGPQHSRMPDRILRSAVRNMLPKYSKRGRQALKRLRVWIGFPKNLQNEKTEDIQGAKKEGLRKAITIGELSRLCGAKF
jgi:ribosomal protein uL13